MKITVINGYTRHGSTWNCKELFLKELSRYGNNEVKEFVLPKDMPYFCYGCFSCFLNGEHTCPHHEAVEPFVEALVNSDFIILTSPVYGLDVTGHMKVLLDHLCFMWLSHRPNPYLFQKTALTIATTAGAGLNHTTKTMKNSLCFWGVKRVFSFKKAVSALKWEDVSEKRKEKIRKEIAKKALKISKTVHNIEHLHYPIMRGILFNLMRSAMKNNTWNPYDRKHWEKLGWLNHTKPF